MKRPWWLVVPLAAPRVLGEIDSDPLTLWTFQSRGAYEVLARDGVLRPEASRRDDYLVPAYEWMERQASSRLPTSGTCLLWAYARIRSRDVRHLARRSDDVLLTLRVPSERVLLSPHDEWHMPLNMSPLVVPRPGEDDAAMLARAEAEWDAWHERLRVAGIEDMSLAALPELPADMRADLEQTWEALFDRSWWPPTAPIQAVLHEICAEDVVRAVNV